MTEEEQREAIEHRDVILHIKAILATSSGKNFFKYLIKHFDTGEVPELGLTGDLLMDRLGFLRAGNSIFNLLAEANYETAGELLAIVTKEKHATLYQEIHDGQD